MRKVLRRFGANRGEPLSPTWLISKASSQRASATTPHRARRWSSEPTAFASAEDVSKRETVIPAGSFGLDKAGLSVEFGVVAGQDVITEVCGGIAPHGVYMVDVALRVVVLSQEAWSL